MGLKIRHKRSKWPVLFILISLGLIVFGITKIIMNTHLAAEPASARNSATAPSAKKPSQNDIDNYKVAADLPRYIYIPAIKVGKTRVLHLGVDKDNQIAVPNNIYDTGWYTDSAKPGQAGAMFIYGHISSWQANGIFHDLNKLVAGDEVTIERGDGKKFTYKVVKSKIYPADKVNMGEVLSPVSSKPGLNLMTCTGTVKKGTSEFTERLVVFAELE